MTDKRVVMENIKIIIQSEKWEELESFIDRNQKKFNLPVELIADRVLYKN
jgi:hypothetical protein